MIEDSIRDEANKFATFWNAVLFDLPELKLDGTWPSFGIVDKILFSLRTKDKFNITDLNFIKGAAAYIGVLAYKAWSSFTECELIVVGDNTKDYLLKTKSENKQSILLCKTLEHLLKNSNKEMSFFAEQSRFYTFDDNLISSQAAGIVSALSPHGSGEWSKLNQKGFEKNLIKAAKVMAESCVKYYKETNGGEFHGSKLELYYPHLVLPPIRYNEPQPGSRSTVALITYCLEQKLSRHEIKGLCKNLTLNPDETISTAGFVISCALIEDKPESWLLNAANSRGISMPFLRPALGLARKAFSVTDFLEDFNNNQLESYLNKIKTEHELGFLPLLYYTDLQEMPEDFLYFISWSSANRAHELLDSYNLLVENKDCDILQLAFLKLNLGMLDQTKELLESHFKNVIPNNKEDKFRYHELYATLYPNSAKEHLEEAVITNTKDDIRFANAGNQLARYYLGEQKYEQALTITEQVTERTPWWHSAQLSRLISLLALKRDDQLEESLVELKINFRLSNQLFAFYKARQLSKIKKM